MSELTIPYPPKWHFSRYKILGTNPKTNRKKAAHVFVLNGDEARAEEKSGLIDIYYIEKYKEDPTEAQLQYAEKLGIPYLKGFDKDDYSCLISLALGEYEYQEIPLEIAEEAEKQNYFISPLADLDCVRSFLKNKKYFFTTK